MRRWPLLLIACAACAKSKPKPGQSYQDAVSIVCHADDAPGFDKADPAQRATVMSQYVAERVTNPDVLAMIDEIGGSTALQRRRLLHEAIIKGVLDTCPALEAIAPWPVPDVGAAHVDDLEARGVVVITEDGVLIADTQVVTMADFVPAADELDGDKLVKLAEQIAPVASIHPGSLTLIVDPRTPYHLLFQVIYSVKEHYHRFALTATSDTARGVVPIALPDPGATPPSAEVEQMVVGLSEDGLALFSITGREGTLAKPALRAPLTDVPAVQAQLQDTLGEIVVRRWKDKTRPAASRRIVLLSSDTVTAKVFVPILAALRMRGEEVLYPDVMLGAGLAEAVADAPDLVEQLEDTRDEGGGALGHVEATVNVEASLTGDVAVEKIERAYATGIKRCYQAQRKLEPTAKGSVKLIFTVSRNGRVVDGKAESDYTSMSACLQAQVKQWTFPVAVDADGDTREAEVTVTFELEPSA